MPQRVIDAVSDCLAHHNANEGGLFAISREVGDIVDEARQGVADLLGCDDPNSIVFGPNMTTLTFALSRALALTWAPGDEIVVTRLDHDANVSPWLLAAKDAGARVRFWDIDSADCTLRVEELPRILTDRTRLVAVGVASNAVGTVNPVQEIVAHAHRVGALVFLDAVHSVPHLATHLREWNCDFLVCSAYKFFGPHLGILWGRKELLERLPAYKIRPAPDTTPGRWMTGTPSFEAIAGTLAAVEYLSDLGGYQLGKPAISRRKALVAAFESIRRYESDLAHRFLGQLGSRPAWRLWGIDSSDRLAERVPTFGVTHARWSPERLAEELSSRGVFVWHGHFYAPGLIERLGLAPQGMLRVGFLHYTAVEEVDRLVAILDDLDRESTG